MAAKSQRNVFKEKVILQEEEKSLKKMLDKFQDQLHRLKIEELALIHQMRIQKSKEEQRSKQQSENTVVVSAGCSKETQEMVEASEISQRFAQENISEFCFSDSDEDDDDSDLFSNMVPVGYVQSGVAAKDDVKNINKEVLDLEVPGGAGGSSAFAFGDNNEEEEEEEEEEDSDEMEEEVAEAGNEDEAAESDNDGEHFMTFMDG